MNDYFDEQEVDDLERIAELALKKGDKKTALQAMRKIDSIVTEVRTKITPEIEAKYPYPEKPEPSQYQSGFGNYAGMKGLSDETSLANWEIEKQRIDSVRKMAAEDPNQLAIIESMSPAEKLGVGFGAGITDVARGAKNFLDYTPYGALLPNVDMPMPSGMQALESVSPQASIGRVTGQAAPFLPAGMGASALPSLGGTLSIINHTLLCLPYNGRWI